MVRYGQNNTLGGVQVGTSGTTYGSGGSTTTTTTGGGGGTYMNYDPRIGNSALPAGIQGTANRAYTRNVQGNELAQNQINQITSQNSPLMRNAQMQGIRRGNARGMINSSMAGEAAQNAVIESAMPLALQDARAYQEAAGQNLQYLNQRDIAEMQNLTQREGQWAGTQNQILANEAALQRQRENLAYSGEQEELGRRYGFQMAGLENQFGTERDFRNYGFDLGRMNQQYQNEFNYGQMGQDYDMRRQVYADQYTRTADYFDNLMGQAMENPDIFDPESISGLFSFYNRYMTVGNPAIDNILGIGG
jgi:hypothetical protein